MVLVRQWFWFSNGGPIVMGPMWSDGLPLFSLLSHFSSVTPSHPSFSLSMDVIRRWFWFDNGGPIVMGPMWSDGLPLFSVLCSLFVGLCGLKESWVGVWVFGLERGSKRGSDCSWVIFRRVPLL